MAWGAWQELSVPVGRQALGPCGASDPCPMEQDIPVPQRMGSVSHGGGELCPMEHGIHVIWSRGFLSYVLIHVP